MHTAIEFIDDAGNPGSLTFLHRPPASCPAYCAIAALRVTGCPIGDGSWRATRDRLPTVRLPR